MQDAQQKVRIRLQSGDSDSPFLLGPQTQHVCRDREGPRSSLEAKSAGPIRGRTGGMSLGIDIAAAQLPCSQW